jgi:hypothetical protein
MHHDLFIAAEHTLWPLASDHKAPTVEPLRASSWVCASALQKALRRGDTDLALRAAASLLEQDAAKLWRRLAGIVFEDVGLGSVETIRLVMVATAGKGFRQQFGGEWAVASLLVEHMAAAPKCRASDDAYLAVSYHHELDELRGSLAGADLPELLSRIRERGALLGTSLAALHASGARWTGQVAGKPADAATTFDAMCDAGADQEIVALAQQGFRKTREALPVLLPLLSLALPSGERSTTDDELLPVVIARTGIPTYCLDAFSWEGKAALGRFLNRDTATGRWLRKYVPAQRRLAVLAGGLFRIEGGLVRQRVQWPCSTTLRWLADSGYHGMKLADPAALLDMMRSDLPALDEARHDVR